jgi:hypothetical protein
MLDFVKAMSDADRLRIIGVLARRPAAAAQVAGELGMQLREALNHLSFLNTWVRSGNRSGRADSAALESCQRNSWQ